MSTRILMVFWDTESNVIAYDPGEMSCYDAAGVLAAALVQAEYKLPDPIPDLESEHEMEDPE